MMLREFTLVVVLVAICGGIPVPQDEGLTTALNAAGAHENKYSCNCHQVPSDDGIRTLQCHCVPKKHHRNATSNAGGGNGDNQNDQGAGTQAPAGNDTSGTQPSAGNGTAGNDTSGSQPSAVNGTSGTPAPAGNGTSGPSPNVQGGNDTSGGNATGTVPPAGPSGNASSSGAANNTLGSQEAQVSSDDDKVYGDDKTNVMCTKPSSSIFSALNSKPDWKWLYVDNSEVELRGKWSKCGGIDSFQVNRKSYQNAQKNCRDIGYPVAQPANNFFSGWYPFLVTGNFTEYYKENSGFFGKLTATYSKVAESAAKNC